jgi:hypothetical protein
MNFQLFALKEALTEPPIRDIFYNLHNNLNETYTRITNKSYHDLNGEAKVDTRRKGLLWVTGTKRPLRLCELEKVVGLKNTDISLPNHRIAQTFQ